MIIHKHGKDGGHGTESSKIPHKEFWSIDKGSGYDVGMTSASKRDFPFSEELTINEGLTIEKFNFMSVNGEPLKKFSHTVLFYGQRVYFKDFKELSNFNGERFLARYHDACPVCGNRKGPQLRYCFAGAEGLPFELFFCSKECMAHLTHRINIYRPMLTELQQSIDRHDYPDYFDS